MKMLRIFVPVVAIAGAALAIAMAVTSPGSAEESLPPLGNCNALAGVLNQANQDQELVRTFDPEGRILTLSVDEQSYEVSVDDLVCKVLHPEVAQQIAEVLTMVIEQNLSECTSVIAELSALDPSALTDPDATIESPKGTVNVQALVHYGTDICALGQALP